MNDETSSPLTVALRDSFARIIDERTRNFSGRDWVFEKLDGWLSDSAAGRYFLLTGGPGTGKSTIAARLAQRHAGAVPADSLTQIKPGLLSYFHFCQAGSDTTLAAQNFVQALAEALASRYPVYRDALVSNRSQQFTVSVNVGTAEAGANVTGVALSIFGGSARPLFNDLVRSPMIKLCAAEPKLKIVILVDSLDEALLIDRVDNIARLLAAAHDLPEQVRFIVTARTNNQEVTDLIGAASLDLIADAPPQLDEVLVYAQARLAPIPEPTRTQAAAQVTKSSHGNFLYAYHIVNALLKRGVPESPVGLIELPKSLEEVYADFLKRQLATDTARWKDVYRPLLGLIAVARGDGLTREQLIGITDLAEESVRDVLTACAEFLVGGENDGPYRIYHQSFREFLLADDRYGVSPADRHVAIARWLEDSYGTSWKKCRDEYALRYTPQHWADAATLSASKRAKWTQSLLVLALDEGYQGAFERNLGNLRELRGNVFRAVQVAALNDSDDMLPWVLRAPLGLLAFDRKYLRAEAVVTLAEQGKLDEALARLPLFSDIGENWQRSAQLILCWLAFDSNPTGATQTYERIAAGVAWIGDDLSARLRARVASIVKNAPRATYYPLPNVQLDVGRDVVRRISGQSFNQEMLQSQVNPSLMVAIPGSATNTARNPDVGEHAYAARADAPLLVSLAAHEAVEGTKLFDDYVKAHAGYNYVVYRNASLCYVLDAAVRLCADDAWVRARLRGLLIAALTGGAVEFREMLPLTGRLLRSSRDPVTARTEFAGFCQLATQLAMQLQNERGRDDTWGDHKRRFTALIEHAALMFDYDPAIAGLRSEIHHLPEGFAGFQAPAFLRYADAVIACGNEPPGEREQALQRALEVAHHVQDYHFCARLTARCNALRRWHALALDGPALAATIEELARAPELPKFAADHVVGEMYEHREKDSEQRLSIAPASAANTLELLAEVFQREVTDFQRLNPGQDSNKPLLAGTQVNVPDPGLAPLLATHFAARVLADGSLDGSKPMLIRSLVATAAANPTALDTLLSYLLIASDVNDEELCEEIVRECGDVKFASHPVPVGTFGPDSVMPA
jgi:hypothetical protein